MRELLRKPIGTREEHRLTVIKALMARPGTQTDLVQRSALSAATVSTMVRELTEEGIVESIGENKNRRTVKLLPVAGVAVGVELGYQNTAVVARRVDQPAETALVQVNQVGAAHGSDAWLDSTKRIIHDLVEELGDHCDDIGTIGIGIPRMVRPTNQDLTPPVLPPWKPAEHPALLLTNALRESAARRGQDNLAGLEVRLDNDASLGALAEGVYQHPKKETLVYIKASTGVGAGIVIGGKLFRGANGIAGEIGHIMVQPRGRFCLCGGRGCLETLIGADALLSNARAVLGAQQFDPPKTLDDLVKKAKDHNPVCRRVLREAATQLGLAIGSMCNLLNPNVVVLGGTLGLAGDLVLQPCRAGIERSAMAAACNEDFMLVGSKMKHATAHGALLLGIDGTGTPDQDR